MGISSSECVLCCLHNKLLPTLTLTLSISFVDSSNGARIRVPIFLVNLDILVRNLYSALW